MNTINEFEFGEKGDLFSREPIMHKNQMVLLGKKNIYVVNNDTKKSVFLLNQGEINCEDIGRE